jgi:hypothetical protein
MAAAITQSVGNYVSLDTYVTDPGASVLNTLETIDATDVANSSTCYVKNTDKLWRWYEDSIAAPSATVVEPLNWTLPAGRWIEIAGGAPGQVYNQFLQYQPINTNLTPIYPGAIALPQQGTVQFIGVDAANSGVSPVGTSTFYWYYQQVWYQAIGGSPVLQDKQPRLLFKASSESFTNSPMNVSDDPVNRFTIVTIYKPDYQTVRYSGSDFHDPVLKFEGSAVSSVTSVGGVTTVTVAAGGLQSVLDYTALTALDDMSLDNGTRLLVVSVQDVFALNQTSTLTVNNQTVVATNSGVGRWLRMFVPSLVWANQSNWFVDSLNGDDENTGLTALTALKTFREFAYRINPLENIIVPMAVQIVRDLGAGDAINLEVSFTDSGALFISGTPTIVESGSLTAFQATNTATNTECNIIKAAGTWPLAGIMTITDAGVTYTASIARVSGTTADITNPYNAATDTPAGTLSPTSTYQVLSYPFVKMEQFIYQQGGTFDSKIRILGLDIEFASSFGAATITGVGIVENCRFTHNGSIQYLNMVNSYFVNCVFLGYTSNLLYFSGSNATENCYVQNCLFKTCKAIFYSGQCNVVGCTWQSPTGSEQMVVGREASVTITSTGLFHSSNPVVSTIYSVKVLGELRVGNTGNAAYTGIYGHSHGVAVAVVGVGSVLSYQAAASLQIDATSAQLKMSTTTSNSYPVASFTPQALTTWAGLAAAPFAGSAIQRETGSLVTPAFVYY